MRKPQCFYREAIAIEVGALCRIAINVSRAHMPMIDADQPNQPLMEARWKNGLPNKLRGHEINA